MSGQHNAEDKMAKANRIRCYLISQQYTLLELEYFGTYYSGHAYVNQQWIKKLEQPHKPDNKKNEGSTELRYSMAEGQTLPILSQ